MFLHHHHHHHHTDTTLWIVLVFFTGYSLHESAVSLIFCQADLAGKHEGVRSLQPSDTQPPCLCLSVCLSASQWFCSLMARLQQLSTHLCSMPCIHSSYSKMLWMKASIKGFMIQSLSICLPVKRPCSSARLPVCLSFPISPLSLSLLF